MNLPLPLRILLWPFSLLYGAFVRFRAWFYARGWLKAKHLKGAVISVGNLTVGGTGKTPMVIWLAEKFLAGGKRVAILSRGYRGSDGTGDEIELTKSRLQNRVAFGVGKDRFAEGLRIEAQQVIDIFLLDDGFQHMQLARDVDIVLIDSSRRLGKLSLLPAGPLREPLTALSRAGMVVFTRTENEPGVREAIQKVLRLPVFAATTRLLGFRLLSGNGALQYACEIGAGPFLAFCGIGNPQAFYSDLESWRVPIVSRMDFDDHHRYTASDAEKLKRHAKASGAVGFVTTEKDAQNLAGVDFQGMPVHIAVIDLEMTNDSLFFAVIERSIGQRRGAVA